MKVKNILAEKCTSIRLNELLQSMTNQETECYHPPLPLPLCLVTNLPQNGEHNPGFQQHIIILLVFEFYLNGIYRTCSLGSAFVQDYIRKPVVHIVENCHRSFSRWIVSLCGLLWLEPSPVELAMCPLTGLVPGWAYDWGGPIGISQTGGR